jgi:ethanolamine utilization protein EutN
MHIARVVGTVVSTVKNETLTGRKLLVIQPVNTQLEDTGKTMIAVDSIGAGVGELIFWCRGKEASFPFDPTPVPTDCTIVGIIDTVFTEKTE